MCVKRDAPTRVNRDAHTHVNRDAHTCVNTHRDAHMHMNIHRSSHACEHTQVLTCTRVNTHMLTCAHTHTHTHTHGLCATRGAGPHLLQPRGLIPDVIWQQDDHAEVLALIRQLQHPALKVLDVAEGKLVLLIHHLHRFCFFLNNRNTDRPSLSVWLRSTESPRRASPLTLFSLKGASLVASTMNFSCQFPLK